MSVRDWAKYRALNVRMAYYRLTEPNYTSAYRRLMDYRVENHGAMEAVGGDHHGIGQLQFAFLLDQGLQPSDRVLDLGCGSLRFGRFAIPYLAPGGYTGMDISEAAINAGRDRLSEAVLEARLPTFVVNDDLRFQEDALRTEPFDVIIANSVFTHLPREDIKECFEHIGDVLDERGAFYATFFPTPRPDSAKDFWYRPQELIDLAREAGLSARRLGGQAYPHPRGQRMLEVRR